MPSHRKKICFVVETLNPHSGWGRLAREIIERISQTNNYDIKVLARESSGYPNEFPVLGSGPWGIIRSVIRARRFMKESDIIHAFDGWPYSIIAYFSSWGLKKPVFITAVGTYSVLPLDRFFQRPLLSLVFKSVKKIMAISSYTKNEIEKRIFLRNVVVINPGVDFEKFYGTFKDPLIKPSILLSVGEIKQRKGYHVALEAFFSLKKKFPDLIYIIAGGGNSPVSNYYRYLVEIIKKNSGEDSVVFAGNISEERLLELYGRAKILILPSITVGGAFEGFGLVVLEANSAGIPAVGTTPSGMDDIIVDEKNGFLVSPNDKDGLSSAIEKLLLDQALYKKMSEGALEVARKMSWDKTIKRYLDYYDKN